MNLKLPALLASLCFCANAFSSEVAISNGNFEYTSLADGSTATVIQDWGIPLGAGGLFNPPESDFTGEQNSGNHGNVLYLINQAWMSKTIYDGFKDYTHYVLSFDVGARKSVSMSNYKVTISVGSVIIAEVVNPHKPNQRGIFETVEIPFQTPVIDQWVTMEIESLDSGHIFFDNFTIAESLEAPEPARFAEWESVSGAFDFYIDAEQVAQRDGFIHYMSSNNCAGNEDFIQFADSFSGWKNVARAFEYDSMMVPVSKDTSWRLHRSDFNNNCEFELSFVPLN